MRNRFLMAIALFFTLTVHADAVDTALQTLAKEQGFFFFYSSSCAHCQIFAPILKRVSQKYGFSVVAISVDGGFLPSFPDALMDEGHTRVFQIKVFPSLFLIHPKKQIAQLITEGRIDEAQLIKRLVKISERSSEERPL